MKLGRGLWSLAALAALAALVVVPVSLGGGKAAATLKIGVIGPMGHPAFNDVGSHPAAKAAVRGVNARGGIKGQQLEVIYCNDKNDPNEGAACARKMVSERVIATVGGVSLAGPQESAILKAAGIPQIGLNPISGPEFNTPNAYLFFGGSIFGYQIETAYAIKKDKSVALVGADNPTQTQLTALYQSIAKAAGGELNPVVSVPPTAADMAPIVASAKRGNPNGVISSLGLEAAKQFILAAEQQGGFKHYYGAGTIEYYEAVGKNFGRLIVYSAFPPLVGNSKSLLIRRFVKEINTEAKTDDNAATVAEAVNKVGISDIPFSSWLAVNVIDMLGEKMRGAVTAKTLTAALNATRNLDLQGVIPPWTPNAPGPQGFSRVSNQAHFLIGFRPTGRPYLITKKPISVADATAGKF
jgi:ABC-type branched-subunit amino acid transport system substrate-binding protein